MATNCLKALTYFFVNWIIIPWPNLRFRDVSFRKCTPIKLLFLFLYNLWLHKLWVCLSKMFSLFILVSFIEFTLAWVITRSDFFRCVSYWKLFRESRDNCVESHILELVFVGKWPAWRVAAPLNLRLSSHIWIRQTSHFKFLVWIQPINCQPKIDVDRRFVSKNWWTFACFLKTCGIRKP